jgi:hypothetical protein
MVQKIALESNFILGNHSFRDYNLLRTRKKLHAQIHSVVPTLFCAAGFLAPESKADILTFIDTDGSLSIAAEGSRADIPFGPVGDDDLLGGILDGPGVGIDYSTFERVDAAFLIPANSVSPAEVETFLTEPNDASATGPTQTEIYLVVSPASECSFCVQPQNGVIYPIANILYTDGTTDMIQFEWNAPVEPIVAPEPSPAFLLLTVCGLILIAPMPRWARDCTPGWARREGRLFRHLDRVRRACRAMHGNGD